MSTKSGGTSTTLSFDVHVHSGTPKHQSFDFAALGPTLLTIAAAVIGYIVVERFARRREARTDLRALMESFSGTLESLLSDATAFYAVAGATPKARALAAVIKSKIAFLPDLLSTMQAAGILVAAEAELIALRKAITGGDFDGLARPAFAPDDGKFVEIAAAIQQLRRRVELTFYESLIPTRVVGSRFGIAAKKHRPRLRGRGESS